MADSLFDQRYRYDFIYPRGRSGETLRAVDTLDGDRPVVIKRPAPHDAPPIRYGQEVSILNERKALMRLAGHPAITALLATGQFTVSGTIHQYIVMERAEGAIIAEVVLELAARGERLPELEMLTILDGLLDLLIQAHSRDIVYNDVDAKHLFWDRDHYRLKVIDWGNAVFLEGDESTPQGVSRQSDIYQVGELIYFILTGGGRVDISRAEAATASEDFRLNFGHEAERIAPQMQAIVSRAVHPNPRLRYATIAELRRDLNDYRIPIERDRNAVIGRVNDRLRRDLSKDDLIGLARTLEPALAIDPGFPAAKQAALEIQHRLNDLAVAADLDAVRIYLQSGNWSRATLLLDELRSRARSETAALIGLLSDWCALLIEQDIRPLPPAVVEAIRLVFERHFDRAAVTLLTQGIEDVNARGLQLLLAERISAQMNDILLLRPSLYRLETALGALAAEGTALQEPRALLREIQTAVDSLSGSSTANLNQLRDGFRAIVEQLMALNSLVETAQVQRGLSNRQLPATTLSRALNAAMGLADNMHIIGKQAVENPREAGRALENSRAIDPANTAWDAIARLLRSLYDLLNSYQSYFPAPDGSDLAEWLATTHAELQPFAERLFDETLVSIIVGLEIAAQSWRTYASAVVQGNRGAALLALSQATDAVSAVSPTLAGWFSQLRSVVNGANYIERHALYGALGRALADGWESFDRSRLAEAERLGKQAYDAARDDSERAAARRLRDLAQVMRDWVERGVGGDVKRTQAALATVELLFTADEIGARDAFSAQMPSKETYLKAMHKGLVDNYHRQSTAPARILFANYVLWGALEAHENRLDDARFWREAAVRALGDLGAKHSAVRALDEFIDRRHDLSLAAALINSLNNAAALTRLERARKALEDNPQARLLTAAHFSLRELEAALRDWLDGEFRAAGIKLENAARAIDQAESQAGFTLTQYRAYIMELMRAAAELHQGARKITAIVESRSDDQLAALRTAHQNQLDVTARLIGEPYTTNLRTWRDTLETMLTVYLDRTMRRSAKLLRFNDVFQMVFIDRHPAYALYRRWQDTIEASPEFPPPPTVEPTPRMTEDEAPLPDPVEAVEPEPPTEAESAPEPPSAAQAALPTGRRSRLPLLAVIAGALIVALVISTGREAAPTDPTPTEMAAVVETEQPSAQPLIAEATPSALPILPTHTPTVTIETSPTPPALLATVAPRGEETATPTRPPSETPMPSATFTASPTATFTPSNTPTPTDTPTDSPPPTATLPPGGLRGAQSILARAAQTGLAPWDALYFSPILNSTDGIWRLGTGEFTGGDTKFIQIDSETLEIYFGANAAERVFLMETTLALTTWNPALVIDQQVFFGAALQNAANPAQQIGVDIRLVRDGVIRLGVRNGNEVSTISERAVSAYEVRLRLEYDDRAGAISLFFNNERLGQPIPFTASAGLGPALYVKDGGVIVYVSAWSVSLR